MKSALLSFVVTLLWLASAATISAGAFATDPGAQPTTSAQCCYAWFMGRWYCIPCN